MSRFGFALALLLWCSACTKRGPPSDQGFVDATVSAISASIPGQLAVVRVREGVVVHKGDVLAELDARDIAAAVDQAKANLEQAQQTFRQAQVNFRAALPPVRGASADIRGAQAAFDQAERDLERTRGLFASRVVAQSVLDAAIATRDRARAQLDSVLANRLTLKGRAAVAQTAILQAEAQVHSMEAALEAVQVQFSRSKVVSPFDGVVVNVILHEGEWAAPGVPVLTLEDRSRMWVRLSIGENRLHAIRLGQQAEVRVLAVPERTFTGWVSEISTEGDFALNKDVKRGRPELRTFRVRVALPEEAIAQVRPGMTAQAVWEIPR